MRPNDASSASVSTPNAHRSGSRRKSRFRGGGSQGRLYAAIDLGTNNCRLLIARPEGSSFRVVDSYSRIVHLGRGITATGRLSDEAMERTIEAIKVCAQKIRSRQVIKVRAIATEACRRAENGAAFLKRVREETGIRFEIITAAQEARLAVAGCAPLFEEFRDNLLVFDIGGGSTEVMWVDVSNIDESERREALLGFGPTQDGAETVLKKAQWISLPAGVVTLHEAFTKAHQTDVRRFNAMKEHVTELIAPFAAEEPTKKNNMISRLQILGTSGTVTTLAGVHLGLKRYVRDLVDGAWMQTADLQKVIDDLVHMTRKERAEVPCIGHDRAELVISGAAILTAIMDTWPTEKLQVADRGLREGLLYQLMRQDIQNYKKRRRSRHRRR